jgi:hypothetical protein
MTKDQPLHPDVGLIFVEITLNSGSFSASATLIVPPSPLRQNGIFSHAPRLSAPLAAGLYWRVRLPRPARLNVFAQRTLQLRQVQILFSGFVFSSWRTHSHLSQVFSLGRLAVSTSGLQRV